MKHPHRRAEVFRVRKGRVSVAAKAGMGLLQTPIADVPFLSGYEVVAEAWPSYPGYDTATVHPASLALTAVLLAQDERNDFLPLLAHCWRKRDAVFAHSATTRSLTGVVFEIHLGASITMEIGWREEMLSTVYARALVDAGRLVDAVHVLDRIPYPELTALPYCDIYQQQEDWDSLERITRKADALPGSLFVAALAYRARALYEIGDFSAGQEASKRIPDDAPEYIVHKAKAEYARACEEQGLDEQARASFAYLRARNPDCWHL